MSDSVVVTDSYGLPNHDFIALTKEVMPQQHEYVVRYAIEDAQVNTVGYHRISELLHSLRRRCVALCFVFNRF